ncbi:hypothetical protein LZ32DRAFT_128800 [Colletotrichum eremochloae]|nr:hypothetical protein LZ32DRAFT_128800 [Colletotrichum eremochloae]
MILPRRGSSPPLMDFASDVSVFPALSNNLPYTTKSESTGSFSCPSLPPPLPSLIDSTEGTFGDLLASFSLFIGLLILFSQSINLTCSILARTAPLPSCWWDETYHLFRDCQPSLFDHAPFHSGRECCILAAVRQTAVTSCRDSVAQHIQIMVSTISALALSLSSPPPCPHCPRSSGSERYHFLGSQWGIIRDF